MICDGEYYVYDPHNNYFKMDWTNMNNNTKEILNYYMITSTASHKEIKDNTIIYSTPNINNISEIDIYIEFAIYSNTTIDYNKKNSSSRINCNPSRPL